MKKILLPIFILFATFSFAQKESWEKIKSLKVAYITEHLDLSSEEAQEFWPVYNAYEEKRNALRRKEHVQIKDKIKDADAFSEKEAEKLLGQLIKLEEEQEELDKAFLKDVSKVISAKKTLLLMRTEEDFKRQLIKQYRQKRANR
ncbi:hypothetical protein ACOCEA_08000 [Maribacter sp. CXY002]|uniref:hypothetical protein n=1 Tax=Maribacter luteocoastalis TaxID=3407671 RepID=UPI003B671488